MAINTISMLKGVRRWFRISDVIILATVLPAFIYLQPAVVLMHYFTGRTGTCSLAQSFASVRVSRAQASATERMKRLSRLVEHDPHGFKLWVTPKGKYWIPENSEAAVDYDLAEQEREIYGTGKTGVHAGDIVLDCGANVGVYTREALAAGAKLVVAIEPAPENLECLRRNFAREISERRVVVYPQGVWHKNDVLNLKVDPRNSARDSFVRAVGPEDHHLAVPLTTIDNLVAELQLPRVDFIKMDIEGAEQNAVRGARQTISKYKPRMALCIYHLPEDPVMVPKLVSEAVPDYRVHVQCLCGIDQIQPEVAHFY